MDSEDPDDRLYSADTISAQWRCFVIMPPSRVKFFANWGHSGLSELPNVKLVLMANRRLGSEEVNLEVICTPTVGFPRASRQPENFKRTDTGTDDGEWAGTLPLSRSKHPLVI